MNIGPIKIDFHRQELDFIFQHTKRNTAGVKSLKDAYALAHNTRPLFMRLTASLMVEELDTIVRVITKANKGSKSENVQVDLNKLLEKLSDTNNSNH